MADLKAGGDKAAIAMGAFGRGGVDLIPALNLVGRQGLDVFIKKIDQMFSPQNIRQAAAFADMMKKLGFEMQGVGLAFTAGFSEQILPTLQMIDDHITDTAEGAKALGRLASRAITAILFPFILVFGTMLPFVAAQTTVAIQALWKAATLAMKGHFSEAGKVMDALTAKQDTIIESWKKDVGQLWNSAFGTGSPEAPDKVGGKTVDKTDAGAQEKERTKRIQAAADAELTIIRARIQAEQGMWQQSYEQGDTDFQTYSIKRLALKKELYEAEKKQLETQLRLLQTSETSAANVRLAEVRKEMGRLKTAIGPVITEGAGSRGAGAGGSWATGDAGEGKAAQADAARAATDRARDQNVTQYNALLAEQQDLEAKINDKAAERVKIQAALKALGIAYVSDVQAETIATTEKVKALGDAIEGMEAEASRASGDRYSADIAQIDKKAEKYELLLRQRMSQEAVVGDLEMAIAAKVQAFKDSLTAKADAEEAIRRAGVEFDNYDQQAAGIQAQMSAGLMSEIRGQAALLKLRQDEIGLLRQAIELARIKAELTNDPALIQRAQQLEAQANTMQVAIDAETNSAQRLAATFEDAGTNALANFFATGITESKNLGEAFKSMAISIVAALQQVIAQMIAVKLMKMMLGNPFGGGGSVTTVEDVGYRAASGGLIRTPYPGGGAVSGRGGGTEDLVPAWLSNDEFVVRAAVVRRPGMRSFLTRVNDGLALPGLRGSQGPHRFADGGLVGPGGRAASGGMGSDVSGQITVGLDEGLVVKALKTPEGQRVLLQVIGKNRRQVRQSLG